MRDKLWFFTSARYYSVNNFVANTFFDDGSPGIDDQYIKSAMARVTWQISPRNKLAAYFDEIDKYRGHDMQSNEDPETASLRWFSPAYNTGSLKWTSTVSNRMLLEAGYSRNLEYYTNSYQEGVEKPRFTPEWFANASRLENDLGGRITAATSQTTQSPERHNLQASLSYVTGAHNFKAGFQYTWGDFWHTLDANGGSDAAVPQQQYRCPLLGARQRRDSQYAALLRRAAEPRSRHLRTGLVAARSTDRQRRHPVGKRQGAGARERVACRPLRPRTEHRRDREPAQLEGLGAPVRGRLRSHGQREDGVQVLAQSLQPDPHDRHRRQLQPVPLADGAAAVARRQPQRHRGRRARLHRLPARRMRDRLHDAVLELRHRGAQRVRRLPAHVEPRERARDPTRAAAPAVGFRRLVQRQLPQSDDDHQPELVAGRLHALHVLQPAHRSAVRGLRAAAAPRRSARRATSTPSIPTAGSSTKP